MSDFRDLLKELEEAGSAWIPKGGGKPTPFWKSQPKKSKSKGSGMWGPSDFNPKKSKPQKNYTPENPQLTRQFKDINGTVSTHRSKRDVLVLRVPSGDKDTLQVFFKVWGIEQVSPPKSVKEYDLAFVDKYAWPGPLPTYKKPEKWISAGGVVLDSIKDHNRIWIFKPSNNYGPWSFPKGRVDAGESKTKTAVREVLEETGLRAKILNGGYLGIYEGGFSKTHFWLMVRKGGSPAQAGHEAEKVELVTWEQAAERFIRGGNRRDVKVIKKALDVLEGLVAGKGKK